MKAPLSQRRSRLVLTTLLLIVLGLSIAAALMIQRGLADTELQDQLREIEQTR
jgi:hypothetical protein